MLHYNRGNAHAALGNHEAAVADFDNAVQYAPDHQRDALFNRANSKYALGRFEEAQRDYSLLAISLTGVPASSHSWIITAAA